MQTNVDDILIYDFCFVFGCLCLRYYASTYQ